MQIAQLENFCRVYASAVMPRRYACSRVVSVFRLLDPEKRTSPIKEGREVMG